MLGHLIFYAFRNRPITFLIRGLLRSQKITSGELFGLANLWRFIRWSSMWIFLLLGGPFVGDHGEQNKLIDDWGNRTVVLLFENSANRFRRIWTLLIGVSSALEIVSLIPNFLFCVAQSWNSFRWIIVVEVGRLTMKYLKHDSSPRICWLFGP